MTDLNQLATTLDQHPDFQVLKRLVPQTQFHSANETPKHLLCIIDTETTGLDTDKCEIIELGYQIVEFDSEGNLYQVVAAENFLNEPEGDITPEVTQVTGLTSEDVKGHHIPWDQVATQLQAVKLFIAHNAGFDRPILERYHDVFVDKVWGCSVAQIDWFHLAKVSSKSQEFLAWKIGHFFYDAHRALDDVQALTQLLSQSISNSAKPALYFLLQAVRQQKVMLKATGAPFEIKDDLRNRGYRWNVGERVWQKILEAAEVESELAWLLEHNTPNPDLLKLKATDTFSIRAR